MSKTKLCPKCGEDKPLDKFSAGKRAPVGIVESRQDLLKKVEKYLEAWNELPINSKAG